MSDDLRKLKDEAALASEKGRHRKAAELYARVAERERDDAQWPHKAGEAHELAAGGDAIGIVPLDAVGGAPPELALAPGAPLASLPLAEVVSGARRTDEFPILAYDIPVAEFPAPAEPQAPPLPPIPLF